MGEVIPHLHLMEQVSSSEHIGTMAENLLRVLSENEVVHTKASPTNLNTTISMILSTSGITDLLIFAVD